MFVKGICLFQEEFCYPVECLTLTVEEVMHIRQVLVKAELEKFQQYKDVYNALKKGKVNVLFTFTARSTCIALYTLAQAYVWGLSSCLEHTMPIKAAYVGSSLGFEHAWCVYASVSLCNPSSQLCFSCRTRKFSLFTWSYTCQFCKRWVEIFFSDFIHRKWSDVQWNHVFSSFLLAGLFVHSAVKRWMYIFYLMFTKVQYHLFD